MKNNQSGTIAPLLLAVLALLIVGVGVYFFIGESREPSVSHEVVEQPDGTKEVEKMPITNSDWKKYSDATLSLEYPAILTAKKEVDRVVLTHSIVHKHPDPCDFQGEAPPREKLTDFDVSFKVVNKSVKEYVDSTPYPGWEYVSQNPFKLGSLSGYRIFIGVEGCGSDTYYFTLSPTKTLVIHRSIITELSGIVDSSPYMKLPGIISPKQADEFFNKIVGSIKVK